MITVVNISTLLLLVHAGNTPTMIAGVCQLTMFAGRPDLMQDRAGYKTLYESGTAVSELDVLEVRESYS